ncbi:uncharacterized protein ACBR49_002276 [Aulostomus maculatus]
MIKTKTYFHSPPEQQSDEMTQKVFSVKLLLLLLLLLVYYATQTQAEVQANCGEDVSLECPGVDVTSMTFLSVTWYKVNNKGKKGIVRKYKEESVARLFGFPRPAQFGEKLNLFLPNVSPEDSGTYECAISAPVGGQNLYPSVNLSVPVCVTQADLLTTKNVRNTTADQQCKKQEELPVTWSIVGYLAVGGGKIVLSLFSIWVINKLSLRSSLQDEVEWTSGRSCEILCLVLEVKLQLTVNILPFRLSL